MRKLHVPNRAAVGAVIGLRFLDEMGDRVKEIKRGMRVRGLRPSPLRPVRAFELYCVQMCIRDRQESSSWTVPADRGDAADVPTGR